MNEEEGPRIGISEKRRRGRALVDASVVETGRECVRACVPEREGEREKERWSGRVGERERERRSAIDKDE